MGLPDGYHDRRTDARLEEIAQIRLARFTPFYPRFTPSVPVYPDGFSPTGFHRRDPRLTDFQPKNWKKTRLSPLPTLPIYVALLRFSQ
jgi:hypothetical protein